MTQSRAKLLVTGGDASLNDEVRRLLAERFGDRVELAAIAGDTAPMAMLAADAMPDGAALFSASAQVLWANTRFHALDAGTKSKVATLAAAAIVVVHDITAAKRRRFKMEAIERAGGDLLRLDADVVRKLNASAPWKARSSPTPTTCSISITSASACSTPARASSSSSCPPASRQPTPTSTSTRSPRATASADTLPPPDRATAATTPATTPCSSPA